MNAPFMPALLLRVRIVRPARNSRPTAVALLALPALLTLLAGCTKPAQTPLAATEPGPRNFTLTCLRALPPMSQGNAVAASTSGGATRYGVCVSGAADKQMQSWWKLQGTTWKPLGRSVGADATAEDVAKMQYGVPPDDVAALLDELAKVRAEAAKNPIHFGVPTKRPQ